MSAVRVEPGLTPGSPAEGRPGGSGMKGQGTRESARRCRQENPPGLGLREDVLMDLHHEVAPRHKLGHKADVARSLEAGHEGEQEGVRCVAHGLQNPLLAVQAAGRVWVLEG